MVKQTAGRDNLGNFAEEFAKLNDDVLFGEVWSREDKLSLRDRSLVTICVFMGKEARSLKVGDIVVIPANVKHWHGAKKDSWFSHIAVEIPGEDLSNEWLEPVEDEIYNNL